MRLISVLGFLLVLRVALAGKDIVCFYDAASYLRPGLAKLSTNDLEMALQFCTHLIYGYAGIKPYTHEVFSLNVDLDMFHYAEITRLKVKYPHLKVYLSVGGDKDNDVDHPLKYLGLLEADKENQQHFIDSSISLLRVNGFDGLDLAFQLPRNKPRKVHGSLGTYWKKFKKLFTGDYIVDTLAEDHKRQYTELAINLKSAYTKANLSLSMTVLPNVNSSWYYDVPQIKNSFDLINLAAFDFLTPERNPEEADYSAPLYSNEDQNRLTHYSVEFQVDYWLNNQCPPQKLHLGVASYGRAWKMTTDSGLSGAPVVPNTEGPADAGSLSETPGLLSWPEICAKLLNPVNDKNSGATAPLRKSDDIGHLYGNYALRPADENGEFGMWVSYDDPEFVGVKTAFAKSKGLGGMALFDLSYDDFRGFCTGLKFPILRAINNYL